MGFDEKLIEKFKDTNVKTGIPSNIKISGIAFVRKSGCEIKWTEGLPEKLINPGDKLYCSILSNLGYQWQKNWNLNAEEIPFTLILSELNYFLESCISKFNYEPAYIEWVWDEVNFYLINIKPDNDYSFRRLLANTDLFNFFDSDKIKINSNEINNTAKEILTQTDKTLLSYNEPLLVLHDEKVFLNLDFFYVILNHYGLTGKNLNFFDNSLPVLKFKLIKYLSGINKRRLAIKKIEKLKSETKDKFSLNFLEFLKILISGKELSPPDKTNKNIFFAESGII
ncbi:MAG: hypothetical protein IAE65_10745 [Ignavibacteria bacterium]|nr:hypothetical protein [Ignavibacteria bacterium]